jgi:hypothetical protein
VGLDRAGRPGSPADLKDLFSDRAAHYGASHREKDKLVDLWHGVLPKEFDDFFAPEMHVHLVNMTRLSWDDLAALTGKVFPVRVPSRSETAPEHDKAEKVEKINSAYNGAGLVRGGMGMDLLMKILSWWLVGTADAVAMVLPDFDMQSPFFHFRDPRTHYPPVGWSPYSQAPLDNTLIAYQMTYADLKMRYPDKIAQLDQNRRSTPSIAPRGKGVDDNGWVWVGEYYDTGAWYVATLEDRSVDLVQSETGDAGHPGVQPVVPFSLYSPSDPKGRSMFSDQASIQAAMSRMFSQRLDFFDRCEANDSMVRLADGGEKRADEIAAGDVLVSREGTPTTVLHTEDNGVKPVYRVRTKAGRIIRVTGNHPLWTPAGWVKAEESLGYGLLPVAIHGTSTRITEDEARLMGYLIGDGGVTQQVNFTNGDAAVLADFRALCEARGWKITERRRRDVSYGEFLVGLEGHPHGKPCGDDHPTGWVRSHGFHGIRSVDKRVPAAVMTGTAEIAAAFLSAYLDCDGYVSAKGGTQAFRIVFYSASEMLLRDVQQLVTRFGVNSALAEVRVSERMCWRLTIGSVGAWKLSGVLSTRHVRKTDRLREWRESWRPQFFDTHIGDQVVSVEEEPAQPTVGIMTDGTHTYVTGGVAGSNTLYPMIFTTKLSHQNIRVGPYAINEWESETGAPPPRIQVVGPTNAIDADQMMNLSLGLQRMLNRNPESFQGAGPANSAKALEELRSGVTGTVRDGYWPTFINGLPKLYAAAMRMDMNLWGETRKVGEGRRRNAYFAVPYRPRVALKGFEDAVRIEAGIGLAGYQGTLEVMQLLGAGIVSLQTALEQMVDFIPEPGEEMKRLQAQDIQKLISMDLAAKAQGAQLQPGALARLLKAVERDGKDLYDELERMDTAGELVVPPPAAPGGPPGTGAAGPPGLGGLPPELLAALGGGLQQGAVPGGGAPSLAALRGA